MNRDKANLHLVSSLFGPDGKGFLEGLRSNPKRCWPSEEEEEEEEEGDKWRGPSLMAFDGDRDHAL